MEANGGRPRIFVDFGQGIFKLDPGIKIIGTVWIPPAWMKMNKSITDRRSVAIRAGGYGNFDNRVDPKYFKHFCKMYEGGTGSYVKAIKDNPKALAALDVFATHGYEDGARAKMSATSSGRFWDQIKDAGKPFWITEGGTGDHNWPAPIHNGIGNALHNALVAGNCSAFVPWQITERRESVHAIMAMSTYTPKTYTAMHYSKFIRAGAKRIDAQPGFGTVQVGAFLHEKNGDLTVVAINPTGQEQTVNLIFKNLMGLASLKAYRTSASENLQEVGEVGVSDNKATFQMTPQSIVTFSCKVTGHQ